MIALPFVLLLNHTSSETKKLSQFYEIYLASSLTSVIPQRVLNCSLVGI